METPVQILIHLQGQTNEQGQNLTYSSIFYLNSQFRCNPTLKNCSGLLQYPK